MASYEISSISRKKSKAKPGNTRSSPVFVVNIHEILMVAVYIILAKMFIDIYE